MIAHFPDPYEDELAYSIFARYSKRMSYPGDVNRVLDLLFSAPVTGPIVDRPVRLGHLVSLLLDKHYTVSSLIRQHTLAPYYAPFFPEEKLKQLLSDMANGRRLDSYRTQPVRTHIAPTYLKFCPSCIEEDRKRYSECYWHRLHQVRAVQVCPKHNIFLEDSAVYYSRAYQNAGPVLVRAEDAVFSASPRVVDSSKHDHHVLRQVARDVEWLLQEGKLVSRLGFLGDIFEATFFERAASYPEVDDCIQEMVNAFKEQFSDEILEALKCPVPSTAKHTWLRSLIVTPRKNMRNPVTYILFIHFLGYSVEEFFQLSNRDMSLSKGNWPCLNPICKNYRQMTIHHCTIRYAKNTKILDRTFSCHCGFTYSRAGIDTGPDAKYRYDHIVSFGKEWDDRLRDSWNDYSVSYKELAERLGFGWQTVAMQIRRLGLSPRPALRSEARKLMLQYSTHRVPDLRQAHRLTMKAIAQELPTGSLALLKQHGSAIYSWLRRNDFEWLKLNFFPEAWPDQLPPSTPLSEGLIEEILDGGSNVSAIGFRRQSRLTKEQAKELFEAYNQSDGRQLRSSLYAVLLYGLGCAVSAVGSQTGHHCQSTPHLYHIYSDEGINGLAQLRLTGKARLKPEQYNELRERLHELSPRAVLGTDAATPNGDHWTVRDLIRAVRQWYNAIYPHSGYYRNLFKKCGFRYDRKLMVYKPITLDDVSLD